jgi:RHS repeat-associated protein
MMRLLSAIAFFFAGILPGFALTQPDTARVGRFSFSDSSTTDPTYSAFVIPLDQQKGVQLSPTTTAPWVSGQSWDYYPWFFKVASYNRYLAAPSGENSVSYNYAFLNPISAFGSTAGGTPLYIGKSYRFGFYAGSQNDSNDLPAEASIQIYSKDSFSNTANGQTPVKVEPFDLAHWKDAAAGGVVTDWKVFGDNGFQRTFVTTVNGVNVLETTVQLAYANSTDSAWGTKFNAPLLITHRALEGAQNYYFVVNYKGVTQVGTKVAWMAVSDTSLPDASAADIPGYTMNFDRFPAWGSTLLKTPNFQGDPAPPTYYGKTAEEIAMLAPRFDIALAGKLPVPTSGAYKELYQTAELQAHSKLDKLVSELGNNAVAIANYVHNEIGLVDALGYNETGDLDEASVNSGGMNRGAAGTFLEGQGSPEEQCALLLYMLRKAGVQAAYIKPPHTATNGVASSPVKMLDQRLSNLLRMRIKGELTPDGHTPVPKFIGVNYPWIAAYLPSDPNNASSPKKWIHLFPWLKDTEVAEGLAVEGYLPSGTKSIRQWVRNFVMADGASPLWALDAEDHTPGNIFTKDLTKNLRDNWQGISIDDVGVRFRDRKFNRTTWEQFPQPCQVDTAKSYVLSDTLTSDGKLYDTMDIVIASVENPTKKLTLSGLKTMDFHNRRAIVNFAYAGTGKLDLSFTLEPFDLVNPRGGTGDFTYGSDPYLLKKQKKTVAVDGSDKNFTFSVTYHRHRAYTGAVGTQDQALLGGWASFLGINEFDFGPNGAAAAGAPIVSYFKLGDLNAFCMNAGRVTERMIQVHLEPFWKHEQDRNANPNLAPDFDLIQGTTAYLMGMTYYQRVSQSFDNLKNLFKVHVASMRAHGFAQLGSDWWKGYPKVGQVRLPGGGTTWRIQQIYPVVDMNFFRGAWAGYGDIRPDAGGQQMVTGLDFMTNLMVTEQSALEDRTIRQFFKAEDADAVSTMDVIHRIQKDLSGKNVIEMTSSDYLAYKTRKYSFDDRKRTLEAWAGPATWAEVEQAFSGWDKDLVRVYITPGPVKGAKGQWEGMGTLILAKDWGAALIGRANGGYGSFSDGMSFGSYDPVTSYFSSTSTSIGYSSLDFSSGFAALSSTWSSDVYSSGSLFADWSVASYSQIGSMVTSFDAGYASPFTELSLSTFGSFYSNSTSYAATMFDIQSTGFMPMGSASLFSGYDTSFGDPVNAITGEMYVDEVDLQLPGPIPLQVRRNYGSQVLTYGSFGHGWKMAYFPYLFLNEDETKIHAAELDGQVIIYSRNTANTTQEEWIVNAADNPLLTNGKGTEIGSVRNLFRNRIVRVTGSPTNYTLYGADGSVRAYQVKSYPVHGADPAISRERPYLKKWSDASGNCLDFHFYGDGVGSDPWYVSATDSSYGQLALVKASNGNSLGFHYDVSGRILDAYTGDGRRVSYRYDADGDLREVTLPDASWVKYDYLREQGKVGSGDKLAWYSTHLLNRETRPGGRVVESDYLLYVSGDKNEKNKSIRTWQVGKASHKRRVVAQRTTSGQHNGTADASQPAAESYKPVLTGSYQYFNTTDEDDLITGRTEILDAYGRKTIYYYDKSRLTKVADPQTTLTDVTNGIGSNFKVLQEWYSAAEVAANVSGQPGAWLAGLKSMEQRGAPRTVFLYNPQGDTLEVRVTGEMDGDASTVETAITTATYNQNHLPELVTRPDRVTGQATGRKTRYYYEDPARPFSITKVEETTGGGSLLRRSTSEYYDVFTITNDLTKPYSKGLVRQAKLAQGSTDEAVTTWTHAPNGFRTGEVKSSGQPDQSAYPDSVLQFDYNLRGELVEERVMEGSTAKKRNRFAYDDMGRRIWIERLDQNLAQVAWDYTYYNKTGEVEWTDGSRTNPEDFTYTRYDGAGRPVEQTGFRSRAKADGSGVEAIPGQYAYSTSRYFYNLFGDLIKTMDPRGNTVRATYDSIGRQLTTTAYEGDWQQGGVALATESTAYNDSERSETRTDARGGVTKVYLTSQGKPRRQINPDGTERVWTYYLDGSPKREPVSAYTYYEYAYDDVNRTTTRTLKNLTGQSLGTETVVYDRRGNTLSTTDLAGNVVSTTFDKLNRAITSSVPTAGLTSAAQSVTYRYDAAGFFQKQTNALGESRETVFDALSRPLSTKSKRSNGTVVSESSSTYSPDFQSVTTVNGTGANALQETTWTDTEGRVVLVKQADGSFVRTEYDAAGNAVATTDQTGQTTRMTYDGLNRPQSTILPDGATTQFVYSYPVGGGQRIERRMPESLTEVQIHDKMGRLLQKFLQGSGGTTTRNYANYQYYPSGKEQGLLQSFVDPNGCTNTLTYDDWLRTASLTIDAAGSTRYVKKEYLAYDVRGKFTQLRETTTPDGTSQTQVSQIDRAYDLQGHLCEEKVSLGATAGTLSVVSHLTETFDAAGRRWTLEKGGSVAAVGAGKGGVWGFGYRPDGLLETVSAEGGTYSYGYGDNGLLQSRTNPFRTHTVTNRDTRGRIKNASTQLSGASVNVVAEALDWTTDGKQSSYTATRLSSADGTGTATWNDTRGYSYSVQRRQLLSESYTPGAGQAAKSISYEFDHAAPGGLGIRTLALTGTGSSVQGHQVGDETNFKGWDAFGRVTNEIAGFEKIGLSVQGVAAGAKNVELRVGNDTSLDDVDFPTETAKSTGAWGRNLWLPSGGSFVLNGVANHPSGLYSATASNSFSLAARHFGVVSNYSQEGELTSRDIAGGSSVGGRSQTLTWDGAGRLTKVVQDETAGFGFTWKATYDGLNRRIQTQTNWATVSSPSLGQNSPRNVIQRSWYDPLVEFLEVGMEVTRTNRAGTVLGTERWWKVHGPDLNGGYGGLQGMGGLEAVVNEQTGEAVGMIDDAYGTVLGFSKALNTLQATNFSYATATKTFEWSVSRFGGYGALPGSWTPGVEDSSAVWRTFGWRGKRIDVTGFYSMGARYYEPNSGRFLSPDPLGHDASMGLYDYAGGDPINFVDPRGRSAVNIFSSSVTSSSLLSSSMFSLSPDLQKTLSLVGGAPGFEPLGFGSSGYQPSSFESTLDTIQFALDVVGMVPVIGFFADVANGCISLARGNYVDAALSFASAIPGIGDIVGGAKLAGGLTAGVSFAAHYGDDALSAYRGVSFTASEVTSFTHQANAVTSISWSSSVTQPQIACFSLAAESGTRRAIADISYGACFVAGTPVLTAGGEQSIEKLQVGDRVLTPQSGDDGSTTVVPAGWRKLALEVTQEDGGTVELELLRPISWLVANGCEQGGRIWLELEEFGVKGWATVRSIDACPRIASGPGRVVLTTFNRMHPKVVDVDLADGSVLKATANHPLYSITRQGWTAAGELTEGEILATSEGRLAVASVTAVAGSYRVFNLEVESDHCYFTGDAHVLSHNSCATTISSDAAKAGANPYLREGAEFSIRLNPTTGRGPMSIDTSTFTSGASTMNGGIRNSRQFWNQWAGTYGDTLSPANQSLIQRGRAPIVDDDWIRAFPEHSRFQGEGLIHHHLDYGPNAIPLPSSVHGSQPGWGIWHPMHSGGN